MQKAQRYKGWNVMHTVPYEVLNVANSTSTRQASGHPSHCHHAGPAFTRACIIPCALIAAAAPGINIVSNRRRMR